MTQSLRSKQRTKNIKNHILGKEKINLDDIEISFSYEILTKNVSIIKEDFNRLAKNRIIDYLKELGNIFFIFDFRVNVSVIENSIYDNEVDKKYIIDISVFSNKGRPTYKNSMRLGSLSFFNQNKRFLIQEINSIDEMDFSSIKLMFHFSYYHPGVYLPMGDSVKNMIDENLFFHNAKFKIFENLHNIGVLLEENEIGLKEENDALEWNRYNELPYLNIDFMILLDANEVQVVYINDDDECISKASIKNCLKLKPHESLDKECYLSYLYDNNFLSIHKIFDKEDFVKNFELSIETYKTIKY